MSRALLIALLLIAISVIILLMNAYGHINIRLLPGVSVDLPKAICLLIFEATGVIIGIFIK